MGRAKAANRLQLILRAAQLGWVDVTSSALLPEEPTELPGRQVLPARGARAEASPRRRSMPPVAHREIPPLTVVAR